MTHTRSTSLRLNTDKINSASVPNEQEIASERNHKLREQVDNNHDISLTLHVSSM